jgi:15-cis-phytoene synthase
MSDRENSDDSAAFCADLVRGHDFVRYASTLFVPADRRRALLALYAFNVEISRVRDQVSQPLPGEIRLQWWTDMLVGEGQRGAEGSGAEGNPVAAELRRAIANFHLPVDPLSRLIDEHQFDLYNDPMPTLAALEGYLTETTSALFALAARIAGSPFIEAEHLARHAGLAQGFTNVIAALPRDASRRQLLVPLQLLENNGCSMEEVFSGRQTPKLRGALLHLIGEARKHLDTSFELLADLPAQVRLIFLPLSLVGRELDHMLRADADLFMPHVRSRLSILWTLWRASRSEIFRGR